MFDSTLLPVVTGVRLIQLRPSRKHIVLVLATTASAARCPSCQHWSHHVHSQYVRHLSDLPWGRCAVHIELHTRRFFCRSAGCRQHIFTQRLPELCAPYGRRTLALEEALQQLGWALGGAGGTPLAVAWGLPASAATRLRLIRRAGTPQWPAPRVVGVDDWAWRKRVSYGTLVVDLERHCAIDVLAERSAESWAAWLRAHPTVEVISRDRAGVYAQGSRLGAPQAIQVADRWHLRANLRDSVQRVVERHYSQLRALPPPPSSPTPGRTPVVRPSRLRLAETSPERAQREQAQYHRARYEQVHALSQQGLSRGAIARQMGMGRATVHKLLQAHVFPGPPARYHPPRAVLGYEALIQAQWEAGVHDAHALYDALRAQGYTGSRGAVLSFVRTFATATPDALVVPRRRPPALPTPRALTWRLLGQPGRQPSELTQQLQAWLAACPQLQVTRDLALRFADALTQQRADAFLPWLEQADACGVPEMQALAHSLREDAPAVQAAFSHVWSNGQVEGQVNRLKLIKRQMYGRAQFDLLRVRVLNKV